MLMDGRRAPLPSDRAIVTAIKLSKLELLRMYIRRSLHLLYTDEYGRNLLHLAATEGVCTVVTLFYEKLAQEPSFNIDVLDKYKSTALHAVCDKLSGPWHVDTIKVLLNAGASPDLKDDQGFTPGRRARRASQDLWDSHVKALFTGGTSTDASDADVDVPSTLELVLRTAKIEAFKAELDSLPDPLDPNIVRYSKSTILHHAIELPDEFRREVLGLLLPRCGHFLSAPDANGQTCAHIAIKQGSLDTLRLLCDAGIDLSIEDRWQMTPFELARRWQRLEYCVFLAAAGAPLPPGPELPAILLRAAVELGELAVVERFVRVGIDINYRDPVNQQTNVQRAQELKDDAAKVSNDQLLRTYDASKIADTASFEMCRDSAPEVVRRNAILQYLLKSQGDAPAPRATHVEVEKCLENLMVKLKRMDPDSLLPAQGSGRRTDTGDFDLRAIRRETTIAGPRRVKSVLPPVPAAIATLKFEADANIVVIAVALILGLVAVTIAWLQSSGSRTQYAPQLDSTTGKA